MENERGLPARPPNLLRPKGPDAIKSKRKYNSILISQAHIKRKVLRRDCAALPRIADGRGWADQRAVAAREGMFLKIEE